MPLTQSDIDEFIKLGATDDEIADIIQQDFESSRGTVIRRGEAEAGEAIEKSLGGRLGRGAKVAMYAMSPLGPVEQMSQAIQGKEPLELGTVLALFGTALGGTALGASGAKGLLRGGIAAAGLESALGAGAGAAIAGPEAEALGQRLGGETGAQIGAAVPAVIGGLAGPAALGAAGRAAKGTAMLALPATRQAGIEALGAIPETLDTPLARSQRAALKGGRYLTPAQEVAAKAFQARTGIKPTAGMAQFLEDGLAESRAKDVEFRHKQSAPAMTFAKQAGEKFSDYLKRVFSEIQPGYARSLGEVGGDVQEQVFANIRDAGKRYEDAESALKGSRFASTPIPAAGSGWAEDLSKLASEFDFDDNGLAFLEKATKKASEAKTLNDLFKVRRWLKTETKNAFNKFGEGTAGTFEEIERQANAALDNKLRQFASESTPGQAALVNEMLDASQNYWRMKFSPEAKLMKNVSGVKGTGPEDLPVKGAEEVGKTIAAGKMNLPARVMKAEQAGIVKAGTAAQSPLAWLSEVALNADGTVNYGELSRVWKALPATAKLQLFGENAIKIQRMIDDAAALTYAGRYKPPTGAALPTLLPGLGAKFGELPVVGPVAQVVGGIGPAVEAAGAYRGPLGVVSAPTGAFRAGEAAALGGVQSGAAMREQKGRRPKTFREALQNNR